MNHYKFIADPASVAYFLKGCIKFTPIPELNDPSELTSNVIYEDVVASLNRLRRDGYADDDLPYLQRQGRLLQRLAPSFQAVGVPRTAAEATKLIRSPFYEQISLLENLLERTANEMSSKVGLFCASRRFDSLPMWAHYAANATGLVVEFVNLDEVFIGDDTGVISKLFNVNYERQTNGITFEPRSYMSLFLEKFQDWRYEEEVRVVKPLDECQEAKDRKLYLVNIPFQHISRLILGWRMDTKTADGLRRQASECVPKVGVVAAKISHGRVVPDGAS